MTTRIQPRAVVRPAVFLLLVVTLIGCNVSATVDVIGKVTRKGASPNIEGLLITFVGADGTPVTALVARDGTYKAMGVPAGEVKVGFNMPPEFPGGKSRLKEEESLEENDKLKREPKELAKRIKANERVAKSKAAAPLIPEKYRNPRTSGITTTLQSGSDNTFDFDIK